MLHICCNHYLATAIVYRYCLATTVVLLLTSWSLPSNGSTWHIASSYKHTAIYSFPRAVLVMSVIGLAFLPRGLFSLWLLTHCSCCSLLKAACPEQFADKVRAGPGVSSTSIYGCAGSNTPHHLSRWLFCVGPPLRTAALVISPSCGLVDRGTLFSDFVRRLVF
jgi:hypothetical protein